MLDVGSSADSQGLSSPALATLDDDNLEPPITREVLHLEVRVVRVVGAYTRPPFSST
jgi:hypothetical protein